MTGFRPIFISQLAWSVFFGLIVMVVMVLADYGEVYCANCMVAVPLNWTWTGALSDNTGWFWVGTLLAYGLLALRGIREQLRTPEASS